MQNQNLKKYKRGKPEMLRLLWDIIYKIGFVFVKYDLFNTTTTFIHNFTYICEFSYKFDTDLYHFFETGTSDRSLKCIIECLKFSCSFLYPFSFSVYSPFNNF